MKRIIGLLLFYLTQFVLMILFLVPGINEFVRTNMPFLVHFWDFYKFILSCITNFLHFSFISDISTRLANMVSAFILNIVVSVIYYIVVLIIVRISDIVRRKRLTKKNLDKYALSEEEKARFDYKLYERKFSIRGAVSYIIPVLIVLFFLYLRFDKTICLNDNYREGYFNIYNNQIRPFLYAIHPNIVGVIEAIILYYIDFVDKVIDIIKINSLEYIIIASTIFIIFVAWSVLVFIFVRINKKYVAKIRAYRAKKKYVTKMEKLELKARAQVETRISSKAQEIVNEDINTNKLFDDASSISLVADNINTYNYANKEKEAEYIDDISTGVTDLGVASTGVEEDEPIERKIPIFIDDEDVDIVLDKEPFVEIEEEFDDYEEDVMPFFEKYSPELLDYSYINESLLETQIEVEEDEVFVKEEEFVKVKDFEEDVKIIEEEPIFEEDSLPLEEQVKETKEEPFTMIEERKEIHPLKEVAKIKKKSIKPISIKNKFDEKERFKNAKKKYFVLPIENKGRNKLFEKKRNLIRRKYKK